MINFKSLSKCDDHKYYIKYMLDIGGKMQTFKTANVT